MPKINYYPEKRKDTSSGTLISKDVPVFLYFSFDGKRLMYYAGVRVDLKDWLGEVKGTDPATGEEFVKKVQRVKRNAMGAAQKNAQLERLSSEVLHIYNEAKKISPSVSIKFLREKLNQAQGKKTIDRITVSEDGSMKNMTFLDCFQNFIFNKRIDYSAGFQRQMKSTMEHLRTFAKAKKYHLSFDSINQDFFEQFKEYYLIDLDNSENSFSGCITRLKIFMNYATEVRNWNTNLAYMKFKAVQRYGTVIYLRWEELMQLWKWKPTSEKLERVRNLFIFQSLTGMRFHDMHELTKANIDGDFIRFMATKTRTPLTIPLNDYTKAVLKKYRSDDSPLILPVISSQKYNLFLKELGEAAGLKREVELVNFKAGKPIKKVLPIYDLMTSHQARRNFIANSMRKGMRTEIIKSISGHSKSSRSFDRYFEVMEDQQKQAMQKIFNIRKK